MAAFFWYASFPNSRIKPRPSTSNAVTYQTTLADYTQPLTKVIDADANRTYMMMENFSSSTAVWYVYAAASAINPSVTPTFGVTDQLIYFTGTNTLYRKTDDGVTSNWVATTIQVAGEKILAQQTASLESPQDVYAAADSAVPVIPVVIVGLDIGTG